MKSLFTTSVYHNKISFDLKDLAQEINLIQKSDHTGKEWSAQNYKNGYTSYGSLDQLHKLSSTFALLEKKINTHVNRYLKQLDYEVTTKSDLKMITCWVNVMPSLAQHTTHIHPQSVISGTFYVAFPTGASAIKFEDPRLGFFMNSPAVKSDAKLENQRFVSLPAKSGDLVLFESWLRHEVPTNQSKTPRISISFNYGWS
ncbi:MAG: hypothetical protein A2622_12165 [Bdellovibrionales bacterium RIFCSPHIGHO2_01_FULL_40_29]|nr:MAG: hypothetical protein A2622_12165 [Bdellovibrionales bacterium RIFCSPHIGHO2_01_FULL_40_29]OFZ32944.1 MAG: hypothetical protein A3D17_09470 [Bdellovibrionales bacterium RIFCSPHIGHO2_02_FULL_40_15]